ncbi:MAG: ABC transporter ATP-binding protein [Planctomycetes bacterium RBG_16_64_10]|nr:MAG: ABC transporter ATP-binding protein [Planctomycetes bacterium RBG_16_64_10]
MIALEGIAVGVGSFALTDISLQVQTGQYGILMGKTGCGKTTLLEAICGLRPISAGRVLLAGRDVSGLKPAERNIGYVPQDKALFTTMNVRRHLAFSLRVRRAEAKLVEERVAEMADLLDIEPLLDRMPQGLSGGEAQRVALGRALASHPRIICLDEPLSAVDEATRDEMYDLLESLQKRTGVTVLHVTHSHSEARRLGDCVLRLEHGRVRQLEPAPTA